MEHHVFDGAVRVFGRSISEQSSILELLLRSTQMLGIVLPLDEPSERCL